MFENDSEILKKCPFCGGNPELVAPVVIKHVFGRDNDGAFIRCQKCGAHTRDVEASVHYSARKIAMDLWNNREGERKDDE